MSIRRKSTAHDLATLRLHPDGSRVQQSSVNARCRTARSTVVDPRGNWIAKDAGGKSFVKTQRNVTGDDVERQLIDLSGDEDTRGEGKGKQRALDSQTPDEDASQEPGLERLNTRTRRRLSFMHDLSFLDPLPVSVSSLERGTDHSGITVFPDPAPDLLKSIHHFASCYYRERGQLFDNSKSHYGKKKERSKRSRENIHIIAANVLEHDETDSETEHTEAEDESSEEDESESEDLDVEDSEKEGLGSNADTYRKNMYKAFDGSALMAIGIVLQEYVAHTLPSAPHTLDVPPSPKRRRTGGDSSWDDRQDGKIASRYTMQSVKDT